MKKGAMLNCRKVEGRTKLSRGQTFFWWFPVNVSPGILSSLCFFLPALRGAHYHHRASFSLVAELAALLAGWQGERENCGFRGK